MVYKPERSCWATYVGWDVTGMGNADFRGVMTGPVGEIQIGKVFVLVRGGTNTTRPSTAAAMEDSIFQSENESERRSVNLNA